jgi:hypothetical protein
MVRKYTARGFSVPSTDADADHARGLSHAFDHQHARIDRAIREMSQESRLVDGDVLDTNAAEVLADIHDAIDQQEWVAMRQGLEDGVDINRFNDNR